MGAAVGRRDRCSTPTVSFRMSDIRSGRNDSSESAAAVMNRRCIVCLFPAEVYERSITWDNSAELIRMISRLQKVHDLSEEERREVHEAFEATLSPASASASST